MFVKILLDYFMGFVNISIEGYYIEKFINMCISKRIVLWNMKRIKSTYLQANISIKDFKRLKYITKKTRCKIQINNKKGMPFLLNRYKKRKVFAFSFTLIIIIIFITSRFIWNIEISGNEILDNCSILNMLEENGLKIGAYKHQIDSNKIIRNIRLENNNIAWISIDLKGTNAIVKLAENTEKPEIINKTDYCNIIANKPGIITKINARTGTIIANEGDIVKAGDLLVARMDGRKIHWKKARS